MHKLLAVLVSVTLGWVIFIGYAIYISKRLPIDDVYRTEKSEVMYHFGYLTSGYEQTYLFSHKPQHQDNTMDATRIRCWVDWSSCESSPWWLNYRINGYAVIAGQINHSATPTFGHFGQDKRTLKVTKILLPPLPISAMYWMLTAGLIVIILILIKIGIQKRGKRQQMPGMNGT